MVEDLGNDNLKKFDLAGALDIDLNDEQRKKYVALKILQERKMKALMYNKLLFKLFTIIIYYYYLLLRSLLDS